MSASTGPPRSHPERQQPVVDQPYESIAASGSSKPLPFQQTQTRRPAATSHLHSSTAQRSVSAQPDLKSSSSSTAAATKETPFTFSAPSEPPASRPTVSRKPGRAVTAAPLASTLPFTTSPEGPPLPATVRPPARVLSASTKPPPPAQSLAASQRTSPKPEDAAPELPVLTTKPASADTLQEEEKAPHAETEAKPDREAVVPVKPLASRPALANATNRAPVASRAQKKVAPSASAGRAAFKPKRPPTAATALLGSKGPSGNRPLTASQSRPAPSQMSEKAQQDAVEPVRQARAVEPPSKPAANIRFSPVKARPRPVPSAAASKASTLAKKTAGAPAQQQAARKVQSSTTRRLNNGGGAVGLGRGTAASEAKAKEAREKRKKREEATAAGKLKTAAPLKAPEQIQSPQVPSQDLPAEEAAAPTPDHVEQPTKDSNPFRVPSRSPTETPCEPPRSSSPVKQPPPLPLTGTSLPATTELYPQSLPSPCIKAHLVPLPDTSDSSLYSPSATRLPAPLVLDSQTVAQAEFSVPTSAAQFALCTKREAPEAVREKHLPSPNSTLARQL